ncbi:hypothetical protein QUB52_20245 [Microcoleus sp. A6-C6]|uniref:hypothetical protein n=1 Tax=Microcoleus sp. A2-C2 TaxID=2818530 RepID=UPI002FD1B1C0
MKSLILISPDQGSGFKPILSGNFLLIICFFSRLRLLSQALSNQCIWLDKYTYYIMTLWLHNQVFLINQL